MYALNIDRPINHPMKNFFHLQWLKFVGLLINALKCDRPINHPMKNIIFHLQWLQFVDQLINAVKLFTHVAKPAYVINHQNVYFRKY